ncbi:MAG: YIP1 family protein, partial [Anaerolineales bacterium]
ANTAYSVLLVTVCTAILTVIGSLIGFLTGYAKAPAGANHLDAAGAAGMVAILFTCLGLVITPLSFYLNNGIAFVSALIFGGKGKYSSQTYLDSLYYVPLGLLGGLIGLLSAIPKAGLWIVSVITLGLGIYSIVLRIRVFKVVHDFGTAKAVVAVLAPAVLLLIPLCIIIVLMIMGPAIGNVFSTINSQLGTPIP